MKRICVVTDKSYLGQKIKLALIDKCVVSLETYKTDAFDLCLWDIDFQDAPSDEKIMTMSYTKSADLPLPCSFEDLYSLVGNKKTAPIRLLGRICYIRGEAIRLTELEASLLSLLISRGGEFVSREEILKEIWSEDTDSGIINVYIHYLREKLEYGEKIILSSRKLGYRIDKKYLGGRDAQNN